jgi:hypothetical protein
MLLAFVRGLLRMHPQLPPGRSPRYICYKLTFDFQPKDSVIAAGRRLGVMILSSDRDYTIRPAPGTELTMDLRESKLRLPIVRGPSTFTNAFDWDG